MLFFGLFRKKRKQEQPEIRKTAPTNQTPKPIVASEANQTVSSTTEEPAAPKKERKMSYHITRHPQGGWQLKKGKADRALKRFETQKEAIDYAKQLEKERGISFIIHKADGSTRKKTY
jgi:hypothetical protein